VLGVPEMLPAALNDMPPGRLPLAKGHEDGVNPPGAASDCPNGVLSEADKRVGEVMLRMPAIWTL
jgi:hypothetical protein